MNIIYRNIVYERSQIIKFNEFCVNDDKLECVDMQPRKSIQMEKL